MLPNDPYILFSVINTRLRDSDVTLEELCKIENADFDDIIAKMKSISMSYDKENNCFRKDWYNILCTMANFLLNEGV